MNKRGYYGIGIYNGVAVTGSLVMYDRYIKGMENDVRL
jgi:hypothetical protein